MFTHIAFVALGSNKGDKLSYFRKALAVINNNDKCRVIKVSSVYETLPYGVKEQENFLNAAVKIKTNYELFDFLAFLKEIEQKLGRHKTVKWGPREIDLDLLFFDDVIFSNEKLTVPHKEVAKRDFVLVPLCEIEPDLVHPEINKKICDICIDDGENNIVRKITGKLSIK